MRARCRVVFKSDSAQPVSYTHLDVYKRQGIQGDAMTMEVCTDNEKIDEDILLFSQALSDDSELLGERLSVLSRLLKDMGY